MIHPRIQLSCSRQSGTADAKQVEGNCSRTTLLTAWLTVIRPIRKETNGRTWFIPGTAVLVAPPDRRLRSPLVVRRRWRWRGRRRSRLAGNGEGLHQLDPGAVRVVE